MSEANAAETNWNHKVTRDRGDLINSMSIHVVQLCTLHHLQWSNREEYGSPLTWGDQIIPVQHSQYHGCCWCPCPLRRQNISTYDINYVKWERFWLTRRKISTTSVMPGGGIILIVDAIFIFPMNNVSLKGLRSIEPSPQQNITQNANLGHDFPYTLTWSQTTIMSAVTSWISIEVGGSGFIGNYFIENYCVPSRNITISNISQNVPYGIINRPLKMWGIVAACDSTQ